MLFFFFFQAEDGIRDYKVTGVQTCALPICTSKANFNVKPHPFYVASGRGCRITDLDGVERLDAINNFTALVHGHALDRKSTRLNSSHLVISYAVFCLKKKNDWQLRIRVVET